MSEEALRIAKKRSKRQRQKGNTYPSEYRIPEKIKKR